jgi:hypothetical protein
MRAATLVATLLACGSGVLHAQSIRRPNIRQGFWIGFGLGSGSAGLDCSTCGDNRFSGFSGYLRLGGTWTRSVLVGLETDGWLRSEAGSISGDTSILGQNTDESISYGSLIVMWYPSRTGALYLKFGLGGMTYRADDGADVLTATAPCASLGVGYEIRLGRNFSIVPYLNNFASSNVLMHVNGVPASMRDDVSITLVQFGVGATWH